MPVILPPPSQSDFLDSSKKQRSSNLELYRIVCMLLIVMFHYVVNSGLNEVDGPLKTNGFVPNSIYLWLFGMWGKVGINCFMLITGYFMCTKKITLKKFLKLLLQIYFYKIIIFSILLIAGYETITLKRCFYLIMPFWSITNNDFVSCFLVFFLTLPFWSIFVRNITKRQHELLLILLLGCYTILGSIPTFQIPFNYVTWFGIIFLIASYIRLYPSSIFENKKLWGWLTLISVLLSMFSELFLQWKFGKSLYLVADTNKIFAVLVAFCSFLWFKNMDIKYSKIINAFGAGTFGVLLIHANSDAMRTWLWKDTVDCIGHYSLSLGNLILYSFGIVLAIFIVCNLIDQLRINTLEKCFFQWYDNKFAAKADAFISRIVNGKQKH